MIITELIKNLENVPGELSEYGIDDYAISLFKSHCKQANKLSTALIDATNALLSQLPGDTLFDKEERFKDYHYAFSRYAGFLQYHSYYRGFVIGQEIVRGNDLLDSIPAGYYNVINLEDARSVGASRYDEALLEREKFLRTAPNAVQVLAHRYERAYLHLTYSRCGYFLIAGYIAALFMQRFAIKDFKPPMEHAEKLVARLFDKDTTATVIDFPPQT